MRYAALSTITAWQEKSQLAFRGNNGQNKVEYNQKGNAI